MYEYLELYVYFFPMTHIFVRKETFWQDCPLVQSESNIITNSLCFAINGNHLVLNDKFVNRSIYKLSVMKVMENS